MFKAWNWNVERQERRTGTRLECPDPAVLSKPMSFIWLLSTCRTSSTSPFLTGHRASLCLPLLLSRVVSALQSGMSQCQSPVTSKRQQRAQTELLSSCWAFISAPAMLGTLGTACRPLWVPGASFSHWDDDSQSCLC